MAVLELEVAESALANEAVQFLFRAHQRRVYSYCYRRLGSREEAEDAVQATFLNAWQSMRRGVRPDAPLPWLYGIAHNVCLTRHRSLRRRGRVERAEANAPEPASPASRRDELHGIDDALRGLPRDQRRAFVLREWRGFSYAEIAETMGVTNSAVESLIFRARRGLAASLEGGVQQVRAGGFAVLELGSLLSGFKGSILGVVGTTGAKVAASVAVVTTATTVAVAPSHPRLSHFLMAPLEAAKSGVHEILAPEKKSDGNGRMSAVQASAAGLPTVAIVSQGAVVGVRPVTAAAPVFGPGVDAALPPELAPVPAVPLPPEVVDPAPVLEGEAPPIETLPPEGVPVDQPPAEAPPTEGQVPLPEDTVPPPEEAPPPVETSGGTDVVPPPEPVEESGASPRTETSTEPSPEPAPSTDEAAPDAAAPDVTA